MTLVLFYHNFHASDIYKIGEDKNYGYRIIP